MTLDEVKVEVGKYVYMENTTMIDAALATIIANRKNNNIPVWLVIIGASSGGKSQILKPLALTDPAYMHRVDDLTEGTFLSGAPGGGKVSTGQGDSSSKSLLLRIGPKGMLVISDLTVLFSRGPESRNAILSQFRMLYDGEMFKSVGSMDKPLHWKGHLGIVAGSTPSIYRNMEEVADMGERFMYWRMHSYDERKATKVAMQRQVQGNELDHVLGDIYGQYIKEVVSSSVVGTVTDEEMDEIINISILAEKMRTVVKKDRYSHVVEYLPTTAFPMRTALQLKNIGEALAVMYGGSLGDKGMSVLRWLGWSLANDEKRRCLQFLAWQINYVKGSTIADAIGLETSATGNILQSLASVGLVDRSGEDGVHTWKISDPRDLLLITRTLQGDYDKEVKLERETVWSEIDASSVLF